MIDPEIRRKRLSEVWSDNIGNPPVSKEPDPAKAAVDVLRTLRELHRLAKESGDENEAFGAQTRARAVWRWMAAEFGDWLTDLPGCPCSGDESAWEGSERGLLVGLLAVVQQAVSPLHSPALDPVGVLFPGWLLKQLDSSLQALSQGEAQPLLAPASLGRHDAPWTWDLMRSRALSHVGFLRGQGIPITLARQRVGAAMKVSPETLRKWEADSAISEHLERGRAAGSLDVTLHENPKFAENDGNLIDAVAWALLLELRREPLHDFAETYRARFGARHNQ